MVAGVWSAARVWRPVSASCSSLRKRPSRMQRPPLPRQRLRLPRLRNPAPRFHHRQPLRPTAHRPTQSKKHKKKVVRDGGTSETAVDIAPGVSPQQASQQRGRTIWLLGKTDENLKTLGSRQLNASQQDTVSQIKRYVEESKTATDKGDLQRAYTLANKARMLSGDLLKH